MRAGVSNISVPSRMSQICHLKHVEFAIHFARVDLIKDLHKDESVEDNRVMKQTLPLDSVDIPPYIQEKAQHTDLVCAL